MASTRIENSKLYVSQTFLAERELVFGLWAEASKVYATWCHPDCKSVRIEIEPKVGGRYIRHLDFETMGVETVTNAISEYDPPFRFAFCLKSHKQISDTANSGIGRFVVIEFTEPERGKTLVQLVQDGHSAEEKLLTAIFLKTGQPLCTGDYDLETNQAAWESTFEKLGELLLQHQLKNRAD